MGTLSTVGRLAASLVARLVKAGLLVGLLAGIPYGLATQIGSPLPRTTPTVEQVGRVLTSPVSDTMVLDLLALALWILWAAFLASFVIEVGAAVQGVPAPRWRPIAPLQTLAGWLVAGVTATVLIAAPVVSVAGHATPAVATVHTSPPPAALFAPAGNTTPASQTVSTVAVADAAKSHARVATTQSQKPVYQVAHDDWMVTVAERYLGNRDRYVDIERLNPGFERRDARFPDHWEPGWKIVLPADAHDRGARPHATGHLVVTAQPAPPSADTPQDPPTSKPGTPGPSTSAPSTGSPTPSTSPSASSSPSPTPRWTATTPVDPDGVVTQPSTGASPSASASATASPDAASPNSDAPTEHNNSDDTGGVTLPGGWVGLPFAAALAAAAAMVWLRRRHRYRPRPINADADNTDLRPLPPPVTRMRRAVRDQAPELLDPPPPQPTVAQYARGDAEWQPPPIGPSGPELAGISGPVPPGGLGLTGPGAEAAARALLVATLSSGSPNDPDAKGEVVIPAETLTTLLGAHAVNVGSIPRLHITRNLPDALSQLLQLVVNRQRTLQEHDADDLDSMRAADPYHPPMPPIVLLAEVPSGEQRAELTNTLYLGAALQISAVLLGEWARGETRTARADGHTNPGERLSVLDVPTTVQLLQVLREAHTGEPTATAPVETALNLSGPGTAPTRSETDQMPATEPDPKADTTVPGDAPEPATTPAPPTDGHAQAPDTVAPVGTPTSGHVDAPTAPRKPAGPRVHIQLFGGVTILDRDGAPVRGLRQHARQLLVYLVVHRNGADLPQIMEVIWPDATLRRAGERLQTEVGDLRGRIRQAAGDEKVQPVLNTGGHYVLNADLVDVDVWQLTDALRRAAAATEPAERIAALRAAVDVHTGALSQGFEYEWIEQPGEQLRRHGIRARLQLADLVAGTDPRHAADLAQAAAALDPYNEDVARQAMRALARAGDAAAVRAQLQRLRDALPEIEEEPSAETIALAAQLQREITGTGRRPTGEHPTDDPPGER